jgi:hypothetical protein
MSGKLDRAIAEMERESQSLGFAAERYVRERRALDEQIPGVWAKMKAAIRLKCQAQPKHLKFMICPDIEAKVERLNDRSHPVLEMRLLRDSGIFEFISGEASGHCTFRLNQQNVAVVCDQDGHPFASIDDAADEVLSLLFL